MEYPAEWPTKLKVSQRNRYLKGDKNPTLHHLEDSEHLQPVIVTKHENYFNFCDSVHNHANINLELKMRTYSETETRIAITRTE